MTYSRTKSVKLLAAVGAGAAVAGLLIGCSNTPDEKNTAASTSSAPAKGLVATDVADRSISFPASTLTWRELPDTGGIKVADVVGDITGSGPYESFVKFPAGKDNPMHTHSQDLPTVVLGGVFYATIDGKRVEYPAGSFYQLPKDLPHLSGCMAGADCLLFQYQTDHFDVVPAK
ncbi:cupin domain-containing protein [Rhodococcus erythropolis]|uniref:cupin domain-containing protein n=1 Tax=Rhodococcus erythropolis TaxID=1833 RepID=UPI001E527318|nr:MULTISPECIES: cupin domain-containing protein [Rhodococcus erythropolis group]MCD2109420.1 cupin domain-containing protein [Rhodococcus qingshengii]MCZ4527411.1 cupin domain-containing protein [Rhodococcus erythropolis]